MTATASVMTDKRRSTSVANEYKQSFCENRNTFTVGKEVTPIKKSMKYEM